MPRVYVGTYHKYASGSISGEWLDLADYNDKDGFLNACRELHKDESDPEFMFQDHEDIPRHLISESSIDARIWDWLALDNNDQTMARLYWDEISDTTEIDDIRGCYQGCFDSVEDHVRDFWEQCGDFKPDDNWWHPTNYIDWAAMARDLSLSGDIATIEHDGQVYIYSNY